MPYTPTRLSQSQPGTSYATAYTVPASTSAIVKEILVCNPTTSLVTLTVSLVASGGTAGVTNNVVADTPVGAGQTVVISLSSVMATGGFISLKASAATSLTVTISGVQIT